MGEHTDEVMTACCQDQKVHSAQMVHTEQLLLEVLELMLEKQQFTFLVCMEAMRWYCLFCTIESFSGSSGRWCGSAFPQAQLHT
jgi:hypothetical protein